MACKHRQGDARDAPPSAISSDGLRGLFPLAQTKTTGGHEHPTAHNAPRQKAARPRRVPCNAPRGLWGSHWQSTHRLLFAAGGVFCHLCLVARKQEPPLSSRWPLLIGTGYNCRRPLRSCTDRVAGPEPIGTWGPPPASAFVLLVVLGGGRSGSGHGRRRID
jgi:hypothetical protein